MNPGTRLLDLSTATRVEIAHALGPDPVALLAGSGVSIWEPSNLPSGKQFTLGVYEALFHSHDASLTPDSDDDKWLRAWFEAGDQSLDLPAVPFEVLMERCPQPAPLLDLVCRLYGSDAPNPVHDAIAKLVANGRVHSVATTNYDSGLESAFHGVGTVLNRVVRECDVPNGSRRFYFKIHGSASLGDQDTIVHRLRYEGSLPNWKRSLLSEIVQNRCLLVLGYSGVDFDICPELTVAGPRSVVWSFRTREEAHSSPGLRRIEEAGIPLTLVIGDMRALLGHVGLRPNAQLARPAFDVASELRRSFCAEELLLWRSQLLNSMGFARLGTAAADALEESSFASVGVIRAQAQGRFHAGRYLRSAELFRRASVGSADDQLRRMCLLDASDAERCAGRLRAARDLVGRATRRLPSGLPWVPEVEGVADLKRVLIERQAAIVSGRLLFPRGREKLAQQLQPVLSRAAARALDHGRWFDFQQVALWATRLGVSLRDVCPPDAYEPPKPRIGYRHLGYPVAVAMEACDRASAGTYDMAELRGFLDLMTRFGCAPQAWKLAYAIIAANPRLIHRYGRALLHSFAKCEYTTTMRVAWLLGQAR